MALAKYDDLIARILEEERDIYTFLNVIFGFLWRKTDFFTILTEGGKLGFPPGGAEKIVLSVFHKWQSLHKCTPKSSISKKEKPKNTNKTDFSECFPVVREEVVSTSDDSILTSNSTETKKDSIVTKQKKDVINSADTYNGADRGSYRWSQTITDLEVLIPVPDYVKKSKEVNIVLTDSKLCAKIKDKTDPASWNSLVDGDFSFKVNKDESVWSLSPGQQISVHLEKIEERWWDSLLTNEPKLDTTNIDSSRPMSDLSEEEQMKVEEIMWNEERKQLGLKTSEQMKAEQVLKEAWNIEGSPFKGTEFDPSVLNIHSNLMDTTGLPGND